MPRTVKPWTGFIRAGNISLYMLSLSSRSLNASAGQGRDEGPVVDESFQVPCPVTWPVHSQV